jgi:hypothetical protein
MGTIDFYAYAAKPSLLVYTNLFLILTMFLIYKNIFLAYICKLKNIETNIVSYYDYYLG